MDCLEPVTLAPPPPCALCGEASFGYSTGKIDSFRKGLIAFWGTAYMAGEGFQASLGLFADSNLSRLHFDGFWHCRCHRWHRSRYLPMSCLAGVPGIHTRAVSSGCALNTRLHSEAQVWGTAAPVLLVVTLKTRLELSLRPLSSKANASNLYLTALFIVLRVDCRDGEKLIRFLQREKNYHHNRTKND